MKRFVTGVILTFILVALGSCSNGQPTGEKYQITDIVLKSKEIHQDYWEKYMGVASPNRRFTYTYEVKLSNDRQDTVVITHQFMEINKHQWKGKTVFVSEGRIL